MDIPPTLHRGRIDRHLEDPPDPTNPNKESLELFECDSCKASWLRRLQTAGVLEDEGWLTTFSALRAGLPDLAPLPNLRKYAWSHWMLPWAHKTLARLAGEGVYEPTTSPSGVWIWVLLTDGSILTMYSISDQWKHSSLASGLNVLAAGEMGCSINSIEWLSLDSGHYLRDIPLVKKTRIKSEMERVLAAYWLHYGLTSTVPKMIETKAALQ